MKIKIWIDMSPHGYFYCSGSETEIMKCQPSSLPNVGDKRFVIEADIPFPEYGVVKVDNVYTQEVV